MTREEVIEQLKMDRDLCNFNPMTGEEEPINEDCRKSAEALDIVIKALEQQPSDDCVSRQAVLEVLKNNRYRFNISQEGYCEGKVLWSENLIKDDACKEIEQLPPVTPTRKKGKWEFIGDNCFKCSECGEVYTVDQFNHINNYCDNRFPKGCPNCATEMEVEECTKVQ